MKQGKLIITLVALPALIAGCDIFDVDNMDAPDSMLTGQVVFGGQPVGVRNQTGSAQILLWQTDWDVDNPDRIESSIPVYLSPSGEFSAMLFDGEYEIQMVDNQGPWQNDATPRSRTVSVRGDTQLDLPVEPYYTIQEENITYSPNPAPGGSITATFKVGQHVTSPLVDLVGVYVNRTTFVDRTRFTVRGERTRANLPELDTNGTITVTVNLPDDIHLGPSPEPRTSVYVRVGVKPVGLTELAFTQVYKIDI